MSENFLNLRRAADDIDAASVKQLLLRDLQGVLRRLLPKGIIRGGHFRVGNVHGDEGQSLEVELHGEKAGLWIDRATGESGDIIDLWAAVSGRDRRTNFPELLRDIAAWCGWRPPTPPLRSTAPSTAAVGDGLGAPTASWDYRNGDGSLIATVYRFDPPGRRKEFLPVLPTGERRFPSPRPLYNIAGIARSPVVYFCEGEKVAQSLIDLGFCATTAMGGANAPVDKTDTSPLAGKRVIIVPDNDAAGAKYAGNWGQGALSAGAIVVEIVELPAGEPEGWDLADGIAEGIDAAAFLSRAKRRSVRPTARIRLSDWNEQRYVGPAPEAQYLVQGVFPLGAVSLLAAMGDTGKGMKLADLALKVAIGSHLQAYRTNPAAFGSPIRAFGTAVVLTAEDDYAEMHRRLVRLDPDERRLKADGRLIVVPLPNAGGPMHLFTNSRSGAEVTDKFKWLRDELLSLKDLRLIVLDPLASFAPIDINGDPAAGSFVMGEFAAVATETGASLIASHHMRKTDTKNSRARAGARPHPRDLRDRRWRTVCLCAVAGAAGHPSQHLQGARSRAGAQRRLPRRRGQGQRPRRSHRQDLSPIARRTACRRHRSDRKREPQERGSRGAARGGDRQSCRGGPPVHRDRTQRPVREPLPSAGVLPQRRREEVPRYRREAAVGPSAAAGQGPGQGAERRAVARHPEWSIRPRHR
jgi:hypothetical protein